MWNNADFLIVTADVIVAQFRTLDHKNNEKEIGEWPFNR
jgi:hypothetical protein